MSFSSYIDGSIIRGQVFSIFVITVAAAEAAVQASAEAAARAAAGTAPRAATGAAA